jgi:hypothetical protein
MSEAEAGASNLQNSSAIVQTRPARPLEAQG